MGGMSSQMLYTAVKLGDLFFKGEVLIAIKFNFYISHPVNIKTVFLCKWKKKIDFYTGHRYLISEISNIDVFVRSLY